MKTIGIYPGNFQPPTKTHFMVYEQLERITKEDTFIVTTDRNPVPDAPLNYGDKEQIWVRHGVSDGNIVKVDDWKNPVEILKRFDEKLTSVIFALNQKESQEAMSKDPKRFLPYKGNEKNLQPSEVVKYFMVIDDTKIDNLEITTANISKTLGSDETNPGVKKKFFRFVFGWFDISLYTLVTAKFRQAYQAIHPNTEVPEPKIGQPQAQVRQSTLSPSARSSLQKMVREVLGEIMEEDYDVNINDPSSSTNMTSMASSLTQQKSPAQQKADAAKQKQDLVKQKQQDERDLDGLQKDLKWKQSDVLKKRKDDIPAKRKELDALNKQIAGASSTAITV